MEEVGGRANQPQDHDTKSFVIGYNNGLHFVSGQGAKRSALKGHQHETDALWFRSNRFGGISLSGQ
jgi:hypothetical protein